MWENFLSYMNTLNENLNRAQNPVMYDYLKSQTTQPSLAMPNNNSLALTGLNQARASEALGQAFKNVMGSNWQNSLAATHFTPQGSYVGTSLDNIGTIGANGGGVGNVVNGANGANAGLSGMLGVAGGLYNLASGIQGWRQNNKAFKSNMESARLSREIAREQLNNMRAEYARLKQQRAATSRAYGGA